MSEVKMKYLLQINYKSGISMQAWFTKFEPRTNAGSISYLEYEVHPDSENKVVIIGINEIESVYRLEAQEC